MIYVHLEKALLSTNNNEFHVKTAKTLEEACELLKVGFDYVVEMDGVKIFRKRNKVERFPIDMDDEEIEVR